jgi:hypothetical protein
MERENNPNSVINEAIKVAGVAREKYRAKLEAKEKTDVPAPTPEDNLFFEEISRFLKEPQVIDLPSEVCLYFLLTQEDARQDVQKKMQIDCKASQHGNWLRVRRRETDGVLDIIMDLRPKNYGNLYMLYNQLNFDLELGIAEKNRIRIKIGIHGDFIMNRHSTNLQNNNQSSRQTVISNDFPEMNHTYEDTSVDSGLARSIMNSYTRE